MILKNDQYNAYDIEYSHIMNEIVSPVVIYSSDKKVYENKISYPELISKDK